MEQYCGFRLFVEEFFFIDDRNVHAGRVAADLERASLRQVIDSVRIKTAIVEQRVAFGGRAESDDVGPRFFERYDYIQQCLFG